MGTDEEPTWKMGDDTQPTVEGRLDALPSIPLGVVRCLFASSEGGRAPEAERLVVSDVAMAAAVLRLANSPVYGRGGSVTSLDAAVRTLGVAVVRKIAQSLAVLDTASLPLDRARFFEHSVASAAASRALARRLECAPPEDAYTAGLMHSLGQLVFASGSGKRYAEVLRRSSAGGGPLAAIEKEVFGIDHGRAGSMLADRWHLPGPIRDVIAHHHRGHEALEGMPRGTRSLVQVVAAADAVLSSHGMATCCRNGREPPPVNGKALTREDEEACVEAARDALRDTLSLLGLAGDAGSFVTLVKGAEEAGAGLAPGLAPPPHALEDASGLMASCLRELRAVATAEEAWDVGLKGIRASMGVDRVLFYAYDAERARLDLRHGIDDTGPIRVGDRAIADFPLAAGGALAHAIRDGQPVVVDDLGADADFLHGIGVSRIAATPVDVLEKTHGIVTVDNPFSGRPVEKREAALLGLLSSQVGLAIENHLLHRQTQKLRSLAERDELTGVNNRRNLMALFQRELDRSRRYGSVLSVAMVDIDFFKSFNDTYGHQAGDEVLRTIAQVLVAASREIDIIGRYGGEEFVGLLPETTLEQAKIYADRLRARVEMRGQDLRTRFPKTRPLTISVGVTQAMPQAGDDVERIIARVDAALYEAKEAGRNCVIVASTSGAE